MAEKRKDVTLRLPKSLSTRIRRRARNHDMSLNEWAARFLEAALDDQDAKFDTPKPREVKP